MNTGTLSPKEICAEAYYGELDPNGLVSNGLATRLDLADTSNGVATFVGSVTLTMSGHGGIAVRVFPWNDLLTDVAETDLMTWG